MMRAWRTLAECTCRRADARFAAQLLQRAGMAGEGEEYRDPSRDAMFLEALKPMDYKKPPPLSPEEKEKNARRAKEYSRLKMMEHRAWQKDLQTKLNLKMAAIAALPEELRADCLTFHISEAPPLNRNIFTLTPPIKDFQKLQQQRQRKRARKGTPGSKKRRA